LQQIGVLKEMPVWVFHGAKDRTVPIENSEKMVAALRAAGGDVRFTVYLEANHNSWTAAYAEPGLYPWLLQYSLAG
jgi:dipeptidyl aminopeptidase/acylaminoacyl peptidase